MTTGKSYFPYELLQSKIFGSQKMAFKVKSNWFWTKECMCSVSFQSNFTLLNSHCRGYRILFLKKCVQNFSISTFIVFGVFFETPQPWPLQQKFLLHIKSWIWMNLCHKKSSSMNFVPGFSQQKYPTSIQSSNISNLSIKYTLLDHCAILCSAHNCKSYGNATSYLRGFTVPA